MKIFKTLSKRGLALFLALTMCMSLLPATALAAEVENYTAPHTHNQDGWSCGGELMCLLQEAHTHTDACYAPVNAAEDQEPDTFLDQFGNYVQGAIGWITGQASPEAEKKLACTVPENHTHSDACYQWTCTAPVAIPAAVQAFLDAAAAIPETVTVEAEAAVVSARAAYDALSDDEKAGEAVVNAYAVLVNAEEALAAAKDQANAPGAPEQPEAVKAFLDAAAKIPAEITVENAAEVEVLLNAAQEAYAVLDYEDLAREDVLAAAETLMNAAAALEQVKNAEPAAPVIPEGATVVELAKLPAAAQKAPMSVWNLFGLVRDNYQDVLGGNFPEALTFVGENGTETVQYADTQENDPAVVQLTADSILYNGVLVTAYFQGVVLGTDDIQTLEVVNGNTIILVVGERLDLEDVYWVGTWSNSDQTNTNVAEVENPDIGQYILVANGVGETKIQRNKSFGGGREVYIVQVKPAQGDVTFDANGAKGTAPARMKVKDGQPITLPAPDGLSRQNHRFLGWSTDKNANLVTTSQTKANLRAQIYPAGSSYVPEEYGNVTLYAIWAQESGILSGTITVAIRANGEIPDEPSYQGGNEYLYLVLGKKYDNVLKYFNPAQTVGGVEAVKANLLPPFYDELVTPNLYKLSEYDANNSYIEWYVIKQEGKNGGEWHIDGAIRDKRDVHLDYRFKPGDTPSSLYPTGQTFKLNGNTSVSTSVSPNTMTWAGYTFLGWNTAENPDMSIPSESRRNGNGGWYQPGDSITLAEDVILYAQFGKDPSISDELSYTVEYYKGNITNPADIVAITQQVWVNDPQVLTVQPIDRNKYTGEGYKFDHTDPEQLPSTIQDEGVIKVYYVADTVEVTFHYQYDNKTEVVNVQIGSPVAEPALPSRADHDFGGWYKDEACTEEQKWVFSTPVTEATDLYAKWTEKQVTITYEVVDGSNPEASNTVKVGDSAGRNVTETIGVVGGQPTGATVASVDTGWEFVGWYSLATCEPNKLVSNQLTYTPSNISESVTYYARFVPKTYQITVNVKNGTASSATLIEEAAEGYTNSYIATVSHGFGCTIRFVPGANMALDTATAGAVNENLGNVYEDVNEGFYAFPNVTSDMVINVVYAEDEIGPNGPDNVPDKYQATVVFAGVNGTVDGATQAERVVTLVDNVGKWSEEGSYTLTAEDIPSAVPADGYTGDGIWDENPEGVQISKDREKLYFVITFEQEQYKTFVEFYFDGEKDESATSEGEDYFESILTVAPETELEHGGKHYALDKIENNDLRVSIDESKNVVKVYYGLDAVGTDPENPDQPDGIPDKYQVKVTYTVTNGTVSLGETYVTLLDGNGNPAENGTGYLKAAQIPTATPAVGYAENSKKWTEKEPTTSVAITGEVTFHVEWSKNSFNYTVNYLNEEDGNAIQNAKVATAEFESKITSASEKAEIEGYVFDHASVDEISIGADETKNVINLYYAVDAIGTDPENPDQPDGTPDKYQITVTFRAVNGTVDGEETKRVVLDKLDANGALAEDGAAVLTAANIPAASANTGYTEGTWDVEPAAGTELKQDTAFTITYRQLGQYTVTYVTNGQRPDGYTAPAAVNVTEGGTHAIVAAPANRAGTYNGDAGTFTFSGWSRTGTITVNGNVTITGTWTFTPSAPNQYTVTYSVTGAIPAGYVPPAVAVVTAGGTFTVAANPAAQAGYYNGIYGTFTFGGWSQTGAVVVNGNMIINGTWYFTAAYDPDPDPYPDPDPDPDPVPTPTPPVTIPDDPTPTAPAPDDLVTIVDENVPLAAPGLNSTDHFDYIKGYGDGTVKPERNITRAEVATIFFRLMTNEYRTESWATENGFTDVKVGDWFNNAISTSAKAGILKGYEDGSFQPNKDITRAEFATIAARFASDVVPSGGMFEDIEGHWAQENIERASAAGWIRGSEGKFRPNDMITRAEVITAINRMLDRVPDVEHMHDDMKTFVDNTPDKWYYAAVQEATNSHDYERGENGASEVWTEILPERDWAALEREWATAASAPVTDAAPSTDEGKKEDGAEDEGEAKTEPETSGDGEN